jgi:alpha-galactosidase
VKSKGGAIGRYNQKWVDAFTQLGYIDKLHFQGDLVCGYKPHASKSCLGNTANQSNSWRTTGDIGNSFDKVMRNILQNNEYHATSGPQHWNDPDLLIIGNNGTTVDEQKTQFSLWCITKAPLIISTDLRNATNTTIAILSNKEAIAVNQDSLGIAGQMVQNTGQQQVWTGPLSGGRYAAVLVNLNNASDLSVQLDWKQLPGTVPATQQLQVRDLWSAADLGAYNSSINLTVAPHGSRLIVLTPSPSA